MPNDVLDQLMTLEEGFKDYCEAVSVDGVIAQTASFRFKKGQQAWVSRGGLLSYDGGIDWALKVPGGATKAVGRMLSGEGLALVRTTANRDGAEVVISANQPGKIATWDLSRGAVLCTKGSFVCAVGDVDISVSIARSPGAALFGGAGLFLQKLSGTGIVAVHAAGDFIPRYLGEGERLLVSTGNLAVFSAGVKYGVRGVGGCGKMLFGGEGLFMTELTGPGWVMLQSLKKLPLQQRRGAAAAQ
jgi:uncharacterized protein (AIM24 family)